MMQEKPATRACAPVREGPVARRPRRRMRYPACRTLYVPDVIGAPDGRQGKSRAGSSPSPNRAGRSGRKLR
jgi:hypothetical protein